MKKNKIFLIGILFWVSSACFGQGENIFINMEFSTDRWIDPTNIRLFVYNSLGRIIEIIDFVGDKSNTTSINLAKYGNGIYYLKLELDEGSFIQKICVVK